MANIAGEAAAAVPAAVPAAANSEAETTPQPPEPRQLLPKGVGRIQKMGKFTGSYQARVYDSLETKKQRGLGSFQTAELASAAVAAAEAQLKEGVSPWSKPKRTNKYKRGEAPLPPAKKLVPSVVVQQRDCKPQKPLTSVPLPAAREDVNNACIAAFLEEGGENV